MRIIGGIIVASCLLASSEFLAGCAKPATTWTRLDGQSINSTQLQADQIICKGDAQKANLTAGDNAAIHPDTFGYSEGMIDVYNGCMAQHGYMAAKVN